MLDKVHYNDQSIWMPIHEPHTYHRIEKQFENVVLMSSIAQVFVLHLHCE